MSDPRPRRLHDSATLRGFVQTLREGIYVTNPRGEFLDANPAFLDMLGVRSLEELKTRHVEDVLVDPSARVRELRELDEKGSVREYELEIRLMDGSVRTVLDTAYVHRDEETGEVFYHGVLVDITERKRLEDQLLEQSLRDPLTGCFNRRYLARLACDLELRPASWGCIVLDVDRFKLINDQLGHDAGDAVLVRLARFLMRQTRAEEAVIRLGGDEFLLVMPGAGDKATERVVSRIRAAAEHERIVACSIGRSARRNGENLETTIHRADQDLISSRVGRRLADPELPRTRERKPT